MYYQGQKMTRFEADGLQPPPWIGNLKAFVEAGVFKTDKNGKLGDRVVTCIFEMYPENHSSNRF